MGGCYSKNGLTKEEMNEKSLILTENDIKLIRGSWKFVAKDDGLTKYGTNMMIKIFLEHKELKPLWKFARNLETSEQMNNNQAIKAHGEKLFNAIDMAVNSLDDLNTLVPILIQLGYSHYNWGVKEQHFILIGEALIGTLEDGLKENFTPKVKKAWIKVFSVVEAQMKIGMRQAESESKAPKHNNNNNNNTNSEIEINNNYHVNGKNNNHQIDIKSNGNSQET